MCWLVPMAVAGPEGETDAACPRTHQISTEATTSRCLSIWTRRPASGRLTLCGIVTNETRSSSWGARGTHPPNSYSLFGRRHSLHACGLAQRASTTACSLASVWRQQTRAFPIAFVIMVLKCAGEQATQNHRVSEGGAVRAAMVQDVLQLFHLEQSHRESRGLHQHCTLAHSDKQVVPRKDAIPPVSTQLVASLVQRGATSAYPFRRCDRLDRANVLQTGGGQRGRHGAARSRHAARRWQG